MATLSLVKLLLLRASAQRQACSLVSLPPAIGATGGWNPPKPAEENPRPSSHTSNPEERHPERWSLQGTPAHSNGWDHKQPGNREFYGNQLTQKATAGMAGHLCSYKRRKEEGTRGGDTWFEVMKFKIKAPTKRLEP